MIINVYSILPHSSLTSHHPIFYRFCFSDDGRESKGAVERVYVHSTYIHFVTYE